MLVLLAFLFFLILFLPLQLAPLVVDEDLLLLEDFFELAFVEHAVFVEQLKEDVLGVRELFVGWCARALHVTDDLLSRLL